MIKPAIVVVGYNRPEGIERLLNSIGKAKYNFSDIPLIVSIDESNRSDEVELVARSFEWNYGHKEIRRFPERQGLRKHIIQCGDLSEKYGAVIILEDDLIVAEDYYQYTCEAHNYYSENESICGVALYSFSYNVFTHYNFAPTPSLGDVYLGQMVVTWGQSWTKHQWGHFKEWYLSHEGKLPAINYNIPQDISSWTKSWGRYFATYMEEKNLYYIFPKIARSTCFSDFGEHNKLAIPFTFVQVPLMHGVPNEYHFERVEELERFDSFYERVLRKEETLSGISGEQICVDLNNMKSSTKGKPYLVTNQKLPYEELATYGLTLRPIILNVIESIPGDELYLYKLDEGKEWIRPWCERRPSYPVSLRRLKYEYHDVSWRVLIRYAPKEFLFRLKDKLGKK